MLSNEWMMKKLGIYLVSIIIFYEINFPIPEINNSPYTVLNNNEQSYIAKTTN